MSQEFIYMHLHASQIYQNFVLLSMIYTSVSTKYS